MKKTSLILTAAIAGLFTNGVAMTATAADDMAGSGKCYGIAKAGQNSCANALGTHSCQGQAKADNDAGDFVMANAQDCEKQGGKTIAPSK
jgi:uncharacterized membrane protein